MIGRLLVRLPHEADAADALGMPHDREVICWNPAPSVAEFETARASCLRGASGVGGEVVATLTR
jgi:hypothetical protein